MEREEERAHLVGRLLARDDTTTLAEATGGGVRSRWPTRLRLIDALEQTLRYGCVYALGAISADPERLPGAIGRTCS